MTIASTTSKVSYNGSGSTGPFSITFKFSKNADIVATKRSSAGVETVLTLTTHYTLTGAGEASGGALTLVTALAVGESLVIARVPGITQEVDYVENSAFPAETHEGALDLLTMICQSLQEQVDRAVKVDISSTTDPEDLLDELAVDVLSAAASAATATTQAGLSAASAATSTTQAGLAAAAKMQAEAARDAIPAFDTIVGEAGSIPRVKVGETTLEFRTPSEVRSDIAAAASGANSNITSLSGLTTPLSVAQGGTASTTAADARTALGAAASGANTDITSLAGTTTNNNAAAGKIGEFVSSIVLAASAISLTSGTSTDITSISLTAGDWDVFGMINFVPAATTNCALLGGGSGTTSATLDFTDDSVAQYSPAAVPAVTQRMPIPTKRVSIASTTTVYLIARPSFTASTLTAYGSIRARRVR